MNNKYTTHQQVTTLLELLKEQGITDIVLSPGSRNAPLLVAVQREEAFRKQIILDERSAAFYALGIAQQTANPVALVCTSGSALLNYAPAIAEAYYQGVPLLVLSADRPPEWLNQDDSQTIEQYRVLAPFVKASYQLPVRYDRTNDHWYTNRMVNEAVNCARTAQMGPVHINIPLEEPLYEFTDHTPPHERIVTPFGVEATLSAATIAEIEQQLQHARKVMVIAGFHAPDTELSRTLLQLSRKGVVVITETISNLLIEGAISQIDRTLAVIPECDRAAYAPDLLIAIGGAVVSRQIKAFIRTHSPRALWYIGIRHAIPDCYQRITHYAQCDAIRFLEVMEKQTVTLSFSFQAKWIKAAQIANIRHHAYLKSLDWCDLKLFELLTRELPKGWNIQASNSTPIRYLQLFDLPSYRRMDCNRGTSGIDGSTSTAIGAATVADEDTLFITGDNSFLYDSNALAIRPLPHRFKAIVIDNGGGAIFRFLPGSSGMECVDSLFKIDHQLNIAQLVAVYGITTLVAEHEEEFTHALKTLFTLKHQAAILIVRTATVDSGAILKDYFHYLATEQQSK